MNSFGVEMIKAAIDEKKYDVISECAKILHPEKNDIVFEEYVGSGVRVFKHKGDVCIFAPEDITIQEGEYLANAIASGEIFDDADTVENMSTYALKTSLPENAMIRQGINPPTNAMMPMVGAVIGRVDPVEGFDNSNISNGYAIIRDVLTQGSSGNDVKDIIDNYLEIKDREDAPLTLSRDIHDMYGALDELNKWDNDDILPDDECIECEIGPDDTEDDDDVKQEGFLTKKPKKLKPIPARDIISYITVEMNNIQDTNDQAMLSGYCCSKLEVADFYLSCIDTNDDRYIVPHTRAFIVQYQNDLNRLLTKILSLKPVNRNDRVWKVDVNYPDGWRG